MPRWTAVVLSALIAPIAAHQGGPPHDHPHHPPMGPPGPEMQEAMRVVEATCSNDVALFCPSPEDSIFMNAPSVLRLGAPRDPLMDFMMNPMAPPPQMLDLSNILDEMMTQALLQQPQEATIIRFYRISDEPEEQPQEQPKEQPQELPAPEQVLDSMIHTLMERSAEKPEVVAQHVVEHGNKLLQSEVLDEDRVRMARRLTEMSPDKFQGPRLPLPFGCQRNHCLMRAFEEGAVSPPCGQALQNAETTQRVVVQRRASKIERESEAFVHFTILYIFLAILTIVALRKHLHRMTRRVRAHLHLKRSILQAVYSNPAIKAKVEDEVGRSIGSVPPLPPHVLAQMGGPQFPHSGFFALKLLKLITFATILTLIFVTPFLAMPLLCVLMMVRFLHLSFFPPQAPHMACSCCCCGLSTDDVQSGNVTSKQACCTCCNGMGVCAPACADCCGLDPDGACDCCSDGCDCCNPPSKCCCCSATPDTMILTDVQANCSCCKGSGVCAEGCKSCCGDETGCDCCTDGCDCCSGDSAPVDCCKADDTCKPVRRANSGVYQGIPIQIV
eukprot:CAMPEP_0119015212 /NCGR_PEP_ID=MMETSP1176-20130426/10617_1 /TAXON_ID=265551 /ORGANISM="Synedropsis recta cf, Strain CCMP1620" /LENGTH=555 /DNA_ID=CAMNT_0006968485 /DNA_START=29 /DNA_END=1696 /DNA_ORIENTATION=-